MKKISIVTPCFNAEKYIEETLHSVINQTAWKAKRVELEYIICDGQSSDRTLEIIESVITGTQSVPSVKLISEPDHGMYDALAKGLKLTSGDIVAYINAGDYYNPYAFDVILDVFESHPVKWLTGYSTLYNEKSQVIAVNLPFIYRRALFACGFYGNYLPAVQQESTFWSSELHAYLDFDVLAQLKYAGDFYLWQQFAKVCDLKIVQSYLGGFRFHRGQLSSHEAFFAEKKHLSKRPRPQDLIIAVMDRLLWSAPLKIKKVLNPQGIFCYDLSAQCWKL